jgi:hypothetical protein
VAGCQDRRAGRCAEAATSGESVSVAQLEDEWEEGAESGPSIGGGLPPGGAPGCACSSRALPCAGGGVFTPCVPGNIGCE